MTEVVRVLTPRTDPVPLVFDSPHSGSIYPVDFGHAIDRMTLRRSEDAHIDEIFGHVVDVGATLVHALFPRSYIDPNRNEDDLDLGMIGDTWEGPVNPTSKTLNRGIGLIWKDMRTLGPIYDRKLTAAEVRTRIEGYWRPYHAALQSEIDAAHARFGRVFHVDCHSMSSMGDRNSEDGEVPRPDFVVSDRDGTTCGPEVLECTVETFRAAGFTVSVNDPYKGFELVRRHGRPAEGRHSIQIEINRALYMEEATLAKTEGFRRIEALMRTLSERLAAMAAGG